MDNDTEKDHPIIQIIKTRKGSKGKQYKAIVEITDKTKFSKKFPTKEEAKKSIEELKKLLIENQGPVFPLLALWQRG